MSRGGVGILVLMALGLGYCALQAPPKPKAGHVVDLAAEDDDADAGDGVAASEVVRGGETYAQYDARRDALDTGRYSGEDECTVDCSGHDAGRRWAEEHGITDPEQCGGKSWSLVEGCRSAAGGEAESSGGEASGDEEE
jgi:hypothetical protein